MNVLFACHRFPFPPNRGGKIRPFNMIRHLSRNHTVTVVSLAHSQQEWEQGAGLKEYCDEVLAEVLPSAVRWLEAGLALPSSRPSSVGYFCSRQLFRRVRERAATRKFDLVLVHCAFAAQYVVDVPARLRVLDFGDIDSGKWHDYSRHKPFPLSTGYRLEAAKLRRYETALASRFDRCTVTSESELQEFKTLGVSTTCTVIPNGVDFSYFKREPCQAAADNRIVFLGRMDYFPNIQGILKFVRDIFPSIRERQPDAELLIVGAHPDEKVRSLAEVEGVTVTGYVPDVRPFLSKAKVAVAPLYLARGTQNKILEAMAAGIPVVSTPEAAKGVGALAGRDLLVSRSEREFAEDVVRILQDCELRRRIADAGRAQVEARHSWPASMHLLDGVLNMS